MLNYKLTIIFLQKNQSPHAVDYFFLSLMEVEVKRFDSWQCLRCNRRTAQEQLSETIVTKHRAVITFRYALYNFYIRKIHKEC